MNEFLAIFLQTVQKFVILALKIGLRRVKIFIIALLIFEVLLNILMLNGLSCLIL